MKLSKVIYVYAFLNCIGYMFFVAGSYTTQDYDMFGFWWFLSLLVFLMYLNVLLIGSQYSNYLNKKRRKCNE